MIHIPYKTPYPASEPHTRGMLDVSGGHQIAWSRAGNRNGVPVVHVHGGPGAKALPRHRTFFDPEVFDIIQIDQRGCGLSTPLGRLDCNATPDLIADMEVVRQVAGVDRWIVAGGSWGVTLGLAYAKQHPDRLLAFLGRGVWLSRPEDIEWNFTTQGAARLFPQAWRQFTIGLSDQDLLDAQQVLGALLVMINSGDLEKQRDAAWRYIHWGTVMAYGSAEAAAKAGKLIRLEDVTETEVIDARFELTYLIHGCYLGQPLLDGIASIAHLPSILIHGGSDNLCLSSQAEALATAWGAQCQLRIVPKAPHSDSNPLIAGALTAAADELGELVRR